MVICKLCGIQFDRAKIPYVALNSRRYAHATCAVSEQAKNPDFICPEIVDPNNFVTCKYCHKEFNKKEEKWVMVGNKYAHEKCYDEVASDEDKLLTFIKELFELPEVPLKIKKQIEKYEKEYNYSPSGIRKALVYHYKIKGNDPKGEYNNTIGIVPYVYQDAYNYYYELWLANQKNEVKEVEHYLPKEQEVHICVPTPKPKKRKLFTFLDDKEDC